MKLKMAVKFDCECTNYRNEKNIMIKIQLEKSTSLKFTLLAISALLSGCAANTDYKSVAVESSYLESERAENKGENHSADLRKTSDEEDFKGFKNLSPLALNSENRKPSVDLASQFDDTQTTKLAADELALKDWLHYVLGDILKVNYILDASAKSEGKAITLNIREEVSNRRLFVLLEDLLRQNGYDLSYNDEIFYVTKVNPKERKGEVVYGFGKDTNDVPQTSREIFQIIPMDYGIRNNYNLILSKLTNAQLIPDFQQGVYYLRGKREEIVKALEFINMVDAPFIQSQHLGLVDLRFISPQQFIETSTEILEREGISISPSSSQGASVAFVPIDHLGSVVVFATSDAALSRVEYWVGQLDKPTEGGDQQYFVYQPKLARATDILDSLAPLLGSDGGVGSNSGGLQTETNANSRIGQSSDRQGSTGATGRRSAISDDLKIVVDERSNSLIIFSTGEKFQQLQPLLKRMDVMPKQVMLEVLIAEVRLTDEFEHGVEFFLNNGNYTVGNRGGMGLTDIVGGVTYALTGSSKWDVTAKLNDSNGLINVISRPSIVVRDGVTANMEVGTQIPIVTSTSSPDIGTTSSVQYRKTGLTLSVTPTVNSQGIVIMAISQQISNVLSEGITAEGAPSIFDRSMETEVVADSGQTVILGGLISEDTTNGINKVPGLGDIPLIGNLFSSKSESKVKTELVILVTPRIIENNSQWDDLKAKFKQSMTQLEF